MVSKNFFKLIPHIKKKLFSLTLFSVLRILYSLKIDGIRQIIHQNILHLELLIKNLLVCRNTNRQKIDYFPTSGSYLKIASCR